ncbi:MAG: rhodanese-like domain-containing protein [bacterium]|nr:rhodanese-like domain-containing protein [bacterium]
MAQSTSETEDEQILRDISPEEFYKLIQEHEEDENFVILDVRTPKEFKQARLENAVNIDFYAESFKKELAKLDKEKTYLMYCRSGRRSGLSLKLMKELNFQEVYNMSGGIGNWAGKKLPIAK